MRITLAASALMLALAAPAHGANKESWGFVESGKEAFLVYGVPESDSLTISFICDVEAKRIEIITTVLPRRPKKGQPVTTTLSNGAVTAAYGGKIGFSTSTEEFHVEAPTAAEPKVVDILKSGTSLTISIPGKQVRVPLRGVATPRAKFETACFGQTLTEPCGGIASFSQFPACVAPCDQSLSTESISPLNPRAASRDNGPGGRQGAVRPARRKKSSNPP